jgi:hypothetical protein
MSLAGGLWNLIWIIIAVIIIIMLLRFLFHILFIVPATIGGAGDEIVIAYKSISGALGVVKRY